MKKIPCSVIFFAVILMTVSSQNKSFPDNIYSYIENTSMYELNQEEGHTPVIPYSSVNEALAGNKVKSMSLPVAKRELEILLFRNP